MSSSVSSAFSAIGSTQDIPQRQEAAGSLIGRQVLFISEAAAFGGHESMALRAAAGLSRAGIKITFRLWAGNERLRQAIMRENDAGAAISIDLGAARDVRLGSLRWWMRQREISKAQRFLSTDVSFARVLVQGRIDSGLVTLQAACNLGERLVSYLPMAHTLRQMGVGTLPTLRERVLRRHYASVPAYIVIDAAVAEDVRRRGACGPVKVIENWIPIPAVGLGDMAAARTALGLPASTRIVATIGRIDFAQKGHPHLLEALASAPGRTLGLHWLIVGDGPDLPALRERVRHAGLADRCHFLAWLDEGMDRVYAAVDAIVLPSNFEGVPLVMMEALARRVPVVGSDLDGMAGWLPPVARFDRTNSSSIVQALRDAMDPSMRSAYTDAFARASGATAFGRFVADWASALHTLADVRLR